MTLLWHRLPVILHDLSMVILAWGVALILRYDFPLPSEIMHLQWQIIPLIVGVQSLILWHSGLYKSIWRFTGLPDFVHIMRAAMLGTLLIVLALALFNRLENIPRSTLLLYPFVLVFLLGIPRLFFRLIYDHRWTLPPVHCQHVLVLGAGTSGDMLVRDMLRNPHCGYIPVGFLDDRPNLHGGQVQGLPVFGGIEQISTLAESLSIDLILIAIPSATDAQMQRIVDLCERSRIAFRTLPKLDDLLNNQVNLSALRDVSIDDLLGREKVKLDWETIKQGLSGKVVFVSGGGGSIGTELCRQIARLQPAALVIFERCEFNLYQAELLIREQFPALTLHCHLGDVTDAVAVRHIFQLYYPTIVFHAAAYKHVPMLQGQIREAVRNNVLGTQTLAQEAINAHCQSFVLISTDKAVNPTNIMGATKRAAEIFCQAMDEGSKTHFITVRFGNVLGSAGSVVPLFKSQIEKGGVVTVTHPEISRYFMTIPEACQLILQAGAMGKGGEIFVLDMGTPVKITYLAEQMIRLAGKVPNVDIKIVYTGLRAGEKLHEELFHADEILGKTSHQKIMLAAQRPVMWEDFQDNLHTLQTACEHYDEVAIYDALKRLVPELHEGC